MPSLRDTETASIRAFLESHADKLGGTVLDYGCGRQPYRDIVEAAGGHYVGYDRHDYGGSVVTENHPPRRRDSGNPLRWHGTRWDTVICTQVIQYVDDPGEFVEDIYRYLGEGAWLLITGPTNWPVVEHADLWRFTINGVARILEYAGFTVMEANERHGIMHGGENWSCGWAIAAQA